MTNWASYERRQLVELMRDRGPQAPTLCDGWTVKDLAAHIAIRERRPDAALGIIFSSATGHTKRVQDDYANKPWEELMHLVAVGAPLWNPMGFPGIDNTANLFEMFVHHEDVHRAADQWKPRELQPELEQVLWKRLSSAGRLMWRRAKVGIVLDNGTSQIIVKQAPKGFGSVTITGTTSDLVLASFGRQQVALTYSGEPADVAIAKTTNCSV